MNPDEFLSKAKKVGGTTAVEVLEIHFLDVNYTSKLYPYEKATNTGLVKIGELVPKQHPLPKFTFRWDEKEKTLDVDIHIGGELKNELWKDLGYKGHHPPKRTVGSNQYVLDIWIPGKQIFTGIIDVGLAFELRPGGSVLAFQGYAPIVRIDRHIPTKLLIGGIVLGSIIVGVGQIRVWQMQELIEELRDECLRESKETIQQPNDRFKLVCDPRDLLLLETETPSPGIQGKLVEAQRWIDRWKETPFLGLGIVIFLSIPWCWYFVLRRIKELSAAIVGK